MYQTTPWCASSRDKSLSRNINHIIYSNVLINENLNQNICRKYVTLLN